MFKAILLAITLLVCILTNVYAQKKGEYKDSFTQTLKNLQAIDAHNRVLKIQKAPNLNKLILLTTIDFSESEAILSKEGWQFTGTDDSGKNAEFAYNLVNRIPWYTLTIPTDDKMTVFTFDEKGIYNNLVAQIDLAKFKLLSNRINEAKSIERLYAKRINNGFITVMLITNNLNDRTNISSTYFLTVALDSSYDPEHREKMWAVINYYLPLK